MAIGAGAQQSTLSNADVSNRSGSADGLGDVRRLVEGIRDLAIDAISGDLSAGGRAGQITIDRSLAAISAGLGQRLALGGAENALVEGINSSQIAEYEVRTLRPNASASFSGSLSRQEQAAELIVTDAADLAREGGSLGLRLGGAEREFLVRAGASLASLAERINRASGLQVKARHENGSLRIATEERGAAVSLRAVTRRASAGTTVFGPAQVSGLNSAQLVGLDTDALTPGVAVALNGSRDTIASQAQLNLRGAAGALGAGSANFRLTGSLGSANLSVTAGESLGDLADRVNAESSTTGVNAEVVGDEVAFRSTSTGAAASVVIDQVVRETEQSVTGVNAAQVDEVRVVSIPDEATVTINGTVTQAADAARQTYQGAAGGLVVDTATFELGGSLGTAQVTVTEGESLTDVAARVNDLTESTGVSAAVEGDDLIFESTAVGSDASVRVSLEEVTQYLEVTGDNAAQVTDFQVISAAPDSTNTLNATVTQAATGSELTYTGFLGGVNNAATFTLTGEQGSASFSVAAFQSLTSVRDEINDETGNTGVAASLSGNTLTLSSTGVGSAAVVEVAVQSGTFETSGGDGNGSAAGLDATLDINGEAVTSTGLAVAYIDALGSYQFNLVDGVTGALDPITITSTAGEFDVTGGDAGGEAYGLDVTATLNGQSLIGQGNDLTATLDGIQFELTFAGGFVGAIDPITIDSRYAEFELDDEDGAAVGQDSTATINGQTLTSSGSSLTVTTEGGSVTLDFAEDFIGAIDPISIDYETTTTTTSPGGGRSYAATGADSRSQFGGRSAEKDGDFYLLRQNGVEVAVRFADGFSGEIDPFTVIAGGTLADVSEVAPIDSAVRGTVSKAIAGLLSLATGGENAGLAANAGRALSLAFDALDRLGPTNEGPSQQGRWSLAGTVLDRLI